MSTIQKRVTTLIFALVMVFGMVFISTVPNIAMAAESVSYEQSNVLDDLQTSTVGGEPFDLLDYPFDEEGQVQVINFVEYCYSYRVNMQDNYGLYLYVYNPRGLNIATASKSNKVQMAVSYNGEGKPNQYEKFDLQFCSKSAQGDYKNLFYKFKVVEHKVNGKSFLDRVNSNERRYDISGIELMTFGNTTATEYGVNGTYKFKGYAKGYGPDMQAESTLTCEVEYLETIKLDVKHTFYRTTSSNQGVGYQDQIDTVYFSVPNRFFEEYGRLQRIKAEWYEYKTNDIVVTSNQDFYDKASPYIGVKTGEIDDYGMAAYNEQIGISLGQNAGDGGGGFQIAEWGWNLGSGYLHPCCQTLYYLFKVGNISTYDPYADIVSNGGVESNALYEYILNYDKTYERGRLPIKDGQISADLFADDIDESRKLDTEYGKIQKGYSYYDFDADVDLHTLKGWQEGEHSFWENWIYWGFGGVAPSETREVAPIYTLKDSDLQGTNAEISDRLLVNANDVEKLRAYTNTAKGKDETVVLFRFATTDYYAAEVDIVELGAGFLWQDKMTGGQAYRAQESVFLDFDVIQLTFNKEGAYTVIPVVSNPVDIVNAVTPPVQMGGAEWWRILLAIFAVMLLLVLLFPLMPVILNVLIVLISIPFKIIGGIFKAIGKLFRHKKRKEGKEE